MDPMKRRKRVVEAALAAGVAEPADVTLWLLDDLKFLHDIGAMDWTWADQPLFQEIIKTYGTVEEKERLRDVIARRQTDCG
jgi:hypothetical protein